MGCMGRCFRRPCLPSGLGHAGGGMGKRTRLPVILGCRHGQEYLPMPPRLAGVDWNSRMNQTMRSITSILTAIILLSLSACTNKAPDYGSEPSIFLPGSARQTWAGAPAINLSGVTQADAILQADLLYGQLHQTAGLNVIPVNRVVEVFAALRIEQVQSEEQAAIICHMLGCDALLVATITAYDPYDPPKMGASLHLFRKTNVRTNGIDPRELVRRASPQPNESTPARSDFLQVVGMFYGAKGYLIEMDRYCGFVYHSLIEELLLKPALADAR